MIAAGVLAIVIELGLVVAVVSFRSGEDESAAPTGTRRPVASRSVTAAASTPSSADAGPSTDPSPAASNEESATASRTTTPSICGLSDDTAGSVDIDPPKASWKYDGPIGYPSAAAYGPGRAAQAGFRYCYQHSPRGALFAAAGAIAFNNRNAAAAAAWSDYMLADGPYRDRALHSPYVAADPGVRTRTIGYRILEYDAGRAKIDLAVRVATAEQTTTASLLFDLVWQRGDWRFSTDAPDSTQAARLADLSGYTSWSDA